MNAERQRQIASMGGKAVPDAKRSFSQNRRLAAEAGRKGGQSVPGAKRSFSQNRELAATAGRKGGQSVPDEKRSFSQNPELAAEAGRKGGQASHGGGERIPSGIELLTSECQRQPFGPERRRPSSCRRLGHAFVLQRLPSRLQFLPTRLRPRRCPLDPRTLVDYVPASSN